MDQLEVDRFGHRSSRDLRPHLPGKAVYEISALIYLGKLYIYWMEVQGKEVNKIKDGNSTSDGLGFKAYVKYSFLDENGKWSAPQRLYIGQNHVDEDTIFSRVWKAA